VNRNARAVFLAAITLLVGCSEKGSQALDLDGESSDELGAAALPSARRLSIRYYLGRTETRCEVYTQTGDQVTVVEETPCPANLTPGERIRIAGRSCTRESPSREEPVVCPDPLTNYEKDHRAGIR